MTELFYESNSIPYYFIASYLEDGGGYARWGFMGDGKIMPYLQRCNSKAKLYQTPTISEN